MTSTIAAVNQASADTNKQQKQTAKEVIAANVQALIEQLEQGHSEALTNYLTAMGRLRARGAELLSVLRTCVTKQTGDMVYIAARRRQFLAIGQRTTILYALERESDHGSTSAVFRELSERKDVDSGPVSRVAVLPEELLSNVSFIA